MAPLLYLRSLLLLALWLMSASIIISVIISWLRVIGVRVPYSNPILRAIDNTADLMLRPIRQSFPATAGGLDFSPMVALIVLQIAAMLIKRLPLAGP